MSSVDLKSHELIQRAENGDWSLACDEKLLQIMQNVASKIENRSATTKSNISSMMLNLDETKVKLSNLTRINSIKNTNYCENLIKDDHLDQELEVDAESQNTTVKLSKPQIAIENGLKLIENCFEKHLVNLDPSNGRSETTVYRPIDKYMSVLPHLIGSDKWKEKWHVGLLDAESIDSSTVRSSSLQPEYDDSLVPESSLIASQDLAQSSSSFSDHMVINQQVGLFDGEEPSSYMPTSASSENPPFFFRPQAEERRIVNLFDDEPPSLQPSPTTSRKSNNLFSENIYGSVESLPRPTLESIVKSQPPVDLFNDNDFDDFIRKIEQQPSDENRKAETVSAEVKKVQDVKKITEEIKKVQLKKVSKDNPKIVEKEPLTNAQSVDVKNKEPSEKQKQIKQSAPFDKQKKIDLSPTVPKGAIRPKSPLKVQPTEIEKTPDKPRLKNITNLFDDDEDDQDDYFSQIIKQKASKQSEQSVSKNVPIKSMHVNLFDDDEEDEIDYSTKTEVVEPIVTKKTVSLLFDDEDETSSIPQAKLEQTKKNESNEFSKTEVVEPIVIKKTVSLLFDDEDDTIAITQTKSHQIKKIATGLFDDKDDSVMVDRKKDIPKKAPEPPVFEDPVIEDKVNNQNKNASEAEQNITESETILKTDYPPVDDIPNHENNFPDLSSKVEDTIHQPTSFNTTLPFLSDEPPDDDWETEEQYDEQPDVIPNSNVLNYSSLPLYDDVPPEDDFMPVKSTKFKDTQEKVAPQVNIETEVQVTEEVIKPQIPILSDWKSDSPQPSQVINEVVTGSIKSKLENFNKKAEETSNIQQPKKPVPGKLNMNLNINVGALMPGARPTSRDSVDRAMANDISNSSDEKFISGTSKTSIDANNENSNLLNNDATKSRAKIQVKRRPSTRKGRQANYRKSFGANLSEDEMDKHDISDSFTKVEPPLTKNLASSVFDDMDDDEDLLSPNSFHNQSNPLIFDDQPPPDELMPKAVTTSKISVFYDDEDDTRLLVAQQKKLQQSNVAIPRQNLSAGLFDDLEEDTFANLPKSSVVKEAKTEKIKETKTAFYDESDDDLFSSRNSSRNPPATAKVPESIITKNQTSKLKPKASLFDDDDEDDLFQTKAKPTQSAAQKSKKLFESDEESEPNASTIFPKKKSGQTLFQDDESDDESLFSSKPKSSTIKTVTTHPKSATTIKKYSSEAVNDPLKDLLGK